MAERFDTRVVTTGSSHGDVLRTNPVLRAFAAKGLVDADPLGLGLRVTDTCLAVGVSGAVSEALFVAGPLARGHVGELMGVPEVTVHAEMVAQAVRARLPAIDLPVHLAPQA